MQVRNARLGMLAAGGFAVQAWMTGKGPIQNAVDHLRDPFGQNSESATCLHNLLLTLDHGSVQLLSGLLNAADALCCMSTPTCDNDCSLHYQLLLPVGTAAFVSHNTCTSQQLQSLRAAAANVPRTALSQACMKRFMHHVSLFLSV